METAATNENIPKAGVLVMSCDAYSDCWAPFLAFFDRYWSDCPFPAFLATNFQQHAHSRMRQLFFNKKSTWSDELLSVLERWEYPYVIYLQDDYFIMKKVNNERLNRLIDKMSARNAAYLRIFPCPGPNEVIVGESDFGRIRKGTEQRTSLQGAIWEKNALIALLRKEESPWQFEINAPARSDSMEQEFLSVPISNSGPLEDGDYPITYYCTAVLKGKWMRGAVALCARENISLDFSRRAVESRWDLLRRKVYERTPTRLQGYMWVLLYRLLNF